MACGFGSIATASARGAHTSTLADTTTGIHVAIPFDFCYIEGTTSCGQSYVGNVASLAGKVDAVWGSKQAVIAPGVVTFFYFDADVDDTYRGGPRTIAGNTGYLDYVNAGHASWMVFQGGFNKKKQRDCSIAPNVFNAQGQWVTAKVNQNLAWESYSNANNIGRIPVDINNPAVVASQATELTGAIRAGYNGLALDSVHLSNPFGRCGVFRQASGKWVWTPLYTAKKTYATSLVNWVKTIRQDVTAVNPSALISVNYGLPSDVDPAVLLPYVDFIFDERGFTKWGTDTSVDAEWKSVVRMITKVQAAGKGILVNAEVPGASDDAVTEPSILWSLANYLLVKGSQTYTYVSPTMPTVQGYGRFYDRPEYHVAIGHAVSHGKTGTVMYAVPKTACYARSYSGGLAIVDPSSHRACSIALGHTYYEITGHTTDGVTVTAVSKSLTVNAASGAILLSTAPLPAGHHR